MPTRAVTTCVSSGAALKMVRRGEKAAERIFLDSRGEPTDDPRTFKEGGTIMFLGGEHFAHKGYGLSIWNEALAAMVGGRANDPEAPMLNNMARRVGIATLHTARLSSSEVPERSPWFPRDSGGSSLAVLRLKADRGPTSA
jgi:LDH2 family malate/lactate/ureidoglycolate dehydrogenase